MNQHSKMLKNLAWLTQLGISLVAPPLLCIWGCSWLQDRFSIGPWLMLVAIALGLGASVSSALRFYAAARQREEKGPPRSFNNHE